MEWADSNICRPWSLSSKIHIRKVVNIKVLFFCPPIDRQLVFVLPFKIMCFLCCFIVMSVEYRLQVLANLANFAYDPINYDHFRKLNILDLFLDVIAEDTDDKAIEFAIGGVCNCCLDKVNKQYLVDNDGVELAVKCLSSRNEETVLSAITTLMYLMTPQTKKGKSHWSLI